ncbi:hypothetical protein [Cupriavidus pauculus]|uniref:Uncharacterized protein n=1 Tax=Cupriavidus pauculus TaxID=82633 RepID=A0A2N5C5H6_9BURK|nr:hypothetical protein [Cupriavidus pauculus]PLP97485.1 hypothetical protein CYJ10_27000 [Cupriavidus pauculus]
MTSTKDDQVGACVYILHMLLQRLESQRPGMLLQMTEGISADQAAASATESGKRLDSVFSEALRMVNLAQAQLQGANRRDTEDDR